MNKTIRFWRDLLGLRLVLTLARKNYRQYFLEISAKDLISFFEWPDSEEIPYKRHGQPPERPLVFDHFSLAVESQQDLINLQHKLEQAGFPVSDIVNHGFIHSIYSYDPNRIPIEFSCNVKGIDIHINPVMGDLHPCDFAKEGTEPLNNKWPPLPDGAGEEGPFIVQGEGSDLF